MGAVGDDRAPRGSPVKAPASSGGGPLPRRWASSPESGGGGGGGGGASSSPPAPSSSSKATKGGKPSKRLRAPRRGPPTGGDGQIFQLLVALVLAVAAFDVAIYVAYHDDPILNSVGAGAASGGSLGIGGDRGPVGPVVDGRKFVRRREGQPGAAEGRAGSDAPPGKSAGDGDGGGAADRDGDSQRGLVDLLVKAGVNLTDDDLGKLPSWSDITSMYGAKPVVVGLDTCPAFRAKIVPSEAYIGPAGMFNTGTNLLAELLRENCALPAKIEKYGRGYAGMRWQVPWGKHTPASWRLHNVAEADRDARDVIEQTDVLPVVTVKDPYGWMGSMCRHPYAAHWKRLKDHCPNLVPNEVDHAHGFKDNGKDGAIPVLVQFKPEKRTDHDSMAGLWNDWYGAYQDVTEYPRLIVRFEDLLLHTEEVVTKVCECAGGELIHPTFHYVSDSAKGQRGPHQGSSGMLGALVRYGDPKKRVEGMTKDDLAYAQKNLRSDLMEAYGYAHPKEAVAAGKA